MSSTQAAGGLDAAAAGIRQGLRRAADTGLPKQDVEQIARTVVFDTLGRRTGREISPSQIELFAEFVTVALAAGVTTENVEHWIADLCGDWG